MSINVLLSVIMPVYNGEKYIRKSIKSILDQSFIDFELIIIDDGSSDNTLNTIKEFQDNRIILLQNKINSGIVFSLNRGLSLAKGEYIARIDSDDICNEERFSLQVNYLKQNPKVGLCSGHIIKINSYDKKLGEVKFPISNKDCRMEFLFGNPIVHPAAMFRKKVALEVGGYEPGTEPAEDLDLWLKISSISEISNLDSFLIYYRVHELNYSTTKRDVYFEKLDEIYKKYELINKYIPLNYKEFYFKTVIGSWNKKTKFDDLKKLISLKRTIILINSKTKYYNSTKLSKYINLKFTHILLSIIKSPENDLLTKLYAFAILFRFDLKNILIIIKKPYRNT